MEHHLSLIEGTKVRVIDESHYTTRLMAIEDAGSTGHFYDNYGVVHSFEVLRATEPENRYLLAAASGEPFLVGESHTLFCRSNESARYKRTSIKDIKAPVFVRLPQKKLVADDGVFDEVDLDKDGLFVEADSVDKLSKLSAQIATCGITVSREKAKRMIRLERGRPSCFASKMLNGNFVRDFEETLDGLCRNGIVIPHRPFNDSMLLETQKSGIIFEGNSIFTEVVALMPRRLETKGRVIHIRLTEPENPFELTWFQT